MGAITTEIRIDAKAAAALHMWCRKNGMMDIAVSSAIRVAAETLASMLPKDMQVETYGEATAYLSQHMKTLNRRRQAGISNSLKQALLAEGRDEQLEPNSIMAHAMNRKLTAEDIDPEEVKRAALEFIQGNTKPSGIEMKVSDSRTPISADEFAAQETENIRKQREAFALMRPAVVEEKT